MDLLYPRICQVIYGDVNYSDYEANNYFTDLDYYNYTNLHLDDEEKNDVELVWRYSSKKFNKKKDENEKKWIEFRRTHTEIDQLRQKTNTAPPLGNYKLQLPLPLPQKSKTQYTFYTHTNNQAFSENSQTFSNNDDASSILNKDTDLLKLRKSAALQREGSFILKQKNDAYLEYINVVNNPAMEKKYLSSTVKLNPPKPNRPQRCRKEYPNMGNPSIIKPKRNYTIEFFHPVPNPSPQRPKLTRIPSKKPENSFERKRPNIPNNTVESKDLDKEEQDLFYTDVDVVSNRQYKSKQINRLKDNSPDIYTEIVIPSKKPPKIDKVPDDDYHQLELELGIQEVEQSHSSFNSNSDIQLKVQEPVKPNNEAIRPAAAGRMRTKIAPVREKTEPIEIEPPKEEIVVVDEDEVEEIEDEKPPQEVEKKPETPEPKTDDFEFKITMPDFNRDIKKTSTQSITIFKPATRSIIKTKQKAVELPTPNKPKKTEIDFTKLKLKAKRRMTILEEKDEEEEEEEESMSENDDWLAKWCIFKRGQQEGFDQIFEDMDYMEKGYLNGENLISGLSRLLSLNNLKMTYLMRIMSLCDRDPFKFGADKKSFAIIAALAQRIRYLDDEWFRDLLPKFDAISVENKVTKVRQLWNFLVDKDTKLIKLSDLLVEMRAGGVSEDKIKYAQEKFLDKHDFDILDYLTYIPLFVHIHEKIVKDPFAQRDQI